MTKASLDERLCPKTDVLIKGRKTNSKIQKRGTKMMANDVSVVLKNGGS